MSRIDNMEFTPDWRPLEQVFTDVDGKPDRCGEFMFMHTDTASGVTFYKHINTRRYLWLDMLHAYFPTDDGYEEISVSQALEYVSR